MNKKNIGPELGFFKNKQTIDLIINFTNNQFGFPEMRSNFDLMTLLTDTFTAIHEFAESLSVLLDIIKAQQKVGARKTYLATCSAKYFSQVIALVHDVQFTQI